MEKQLVKYLNQEGEGNKVSIRNARKRANEDIKMFQKDGISEDDAKKAEDKVQDITNEFSKKIDDIMKIKESEIMTV